MSAEQDVLVSRVDAQRQLGIGHNKFYDLVKRGRLQANGLACVKVTRPGPYGNPFRVGMWKGYGAADAVRDFERWYARDPCMRSCDIAFGEPPPVDDLRDQNLACFCKLCPTHARGKPFDVECAQCAPCHADVLGRIANA